MAGPVRAYPRNQAPATAFANGTPERETASAEEYFQVAAPHANAADGTVTQRYRVDAGPWRAMPKNRVFDTGTLRPDFSKTARICSNSFHSERSTTIATSPAWASRWPS